MDELTQRTNALKAMPLLADLPHGELEKLARRLTVEQHRPGSVIIKEGSSGGAASFIVSGSCEVRREGKRGSKRIAVLRRGECFGELSIINPAPRSASVVALEPVDLLVLGEGDFRDALRSNRAVALQLVRTLAKRLQSREDEFAA
ncbi:MAG: cyclic nucleotide-binding domain-containing protein [Myxococcaceae bacterium]|nr:cyclic nucleotide-binding domain-containing protein [Myxococcaceae bacterium]MCA3015194.1 cyclic nucleotide-binding domain-containing protein [Myxococcaceae bacterium]